jgi:mono/diheme cytochrome c family protein
MRVVSEKMSTQGGFVQRKSRRIGATLVVLAVLVGGGASSYAASAHHGQAQTIVKVSAALKGTGVSGSFSGTLNAKPASGLLAWKFTLSPSTTVSAAELHTGATGAGALLGKLCGPCSVSHGTKTLTKSAATAVASGKAAIVLRTATHGKVLGHVKAASGSPSAGGGLVITPTPALVAQGKALTAKFSCGGCHTIDGTNGLSHLTGSWDVDQMRMNIAKLQQTKPFMPPFAGTPEELEALVQYVAWSNGGRPPEWKSTLDRPAVSQIAAWLAEAGTEPRVAE